MNSDSYLEPPSFDEGTPEDWKVEYTFSCHVGSFDSLDYEYIEDYLSGDASCDSIKAAIDMGDDMAEEHGVPVTITAKNDSNKPYPVFANPVGRGLVFTLIVEPKR